MNLIQVDEFLANPPDKPAILNVIRGPPAKLKPITVPRGIAKAPAVDFKMLDNNIAYVRSALVDSGQSAGSPQGSGRSF